MAFQSFESLEVWRRSKDLAVAVYKALASCRDFGLRDQMTRAAVSIPSNIAEGYERHSPAEKRHFYSYAKGSAAELRTQLIIAGEVGVVTKVDAERMIREATEISAMVHGLIKSTQE
jgi:four helix bundle protein